MQCEARQIALHQFSSLTPHRASLLAGCTDRRGGVSRPPYEELNLGLHVGDDVRAVIENRRRLASAVGVDLSSFVLPQQVHGGEVRVVTAAHRGRGAFTGEDAVPDADALITREAGIVLAVMLADCVPVVVFDPLTLAVGVVHAGWSGTVQHVARNTVEAMRREFGSDPATLLAGVGPSIGPHSYEVGADVAERAQSEFPDVGVLHPQLNGTPQDGSQLDGLQPDGPQPDGPQREGKFLLDLWSANVADLISAGVPRERIEVAGLDTFQMPERFFSHRRRQPTGRFCALAMLRS